MDKISYLRNELSKMVGVLHAKGIDTHLIKETVGFLGDLKENQKR